MRDSKITRRELLVTTGTVALVGLVSTEGSAAALVEKSPLVFVDSLLSADELAWGTRELAPFRPDVLKLDLVWQWRGELHSHIARGSKLIAITRWDKALLLKELAREARFPLGQDRIAPSLFRTDISPGAAV
jgi:hypothetical protein